MKKIITLTTITLLHTLPLTAISCPQHDHSNDHNPWITLFNEQNLDGWTPKFNGHPPGENPDNIFRVIDGAITVTYQDFSPPTFKEHFGNLIYNQPLTNYHFKCDYRFFGEQAPGASSWAFANSGAMLHGESPQQMGIDQPHPTSLEFQFLAQDDTGERVTGSICSPGTYLDLNGQTIKKHVTKSQKLARPLGEWVTAEVIIHNGTVQHIINGEIVIEYNNLRRDDGTPLTHGYISLQAESHPCQFRNIQLKILD